MQLIYTRHWRKKKRQRKSISDDIIEYAIMHGRIRRDKYWGNASNILVNIPSSGRRLKVVFRKVNYKDIKIITAYWID